MLWAHSVCAQNSCDYFPADCPDSETLQQEGSQQWSGASDLKIKEEYAMQDSLRRFTLSMVREIARKNNWQYYIYQEDQSSGIGINGNTQPLPYTLRPPCQWGMNIVFIINSDSLNAWKNWYSNDLQNRANEVVSSYQQAAATFVDPQKSDTDSAMYYADEKTKYMTDHSAEYQKAILSNDAKAQKKYENEMKWYDDRINNYVDKVNNKTADRFSSSDNKNNTLQDYKLRKTIAWRNASVLRVSIEFNGRHIPATDIGGTDPDLQAKIEKTTKPAPVLNTTYAVYQHNDQPGNEWFHGPDIALILLGSWELKEDAYYCHTGFAKDNKNTDLVSPKKIACDKVQAIDIHAEGSKLSLARFLEALEMPKFNALIAK